MDKTIKSLLFVALFASHISAQIEFVASIPPFEQIVREIVSPRAKVHALLPPGASPHSFEPRPSDIRRVSIATAFFKGGPKLDDWTNHFENPNTIELFKLVPEDYVLYLKNNFNNKNLGADPHFWTDPLTVKAILNPVTERLCELDPQGCSIYQKNASRFSSELDSLHALIASRFASKKTSVFISHPFFQYYLNRYGIELVGSIEVIPGTEPTPREIKNLIRIANERKVQAILTHSQLSERPAEIIAEATGIAIVELDPLGGVAGRNSFRELILYNTEKLLKAIQ